MTKSMSFKHNNVYYTITKSNGKYKFTRGNNVIERSEWVKAHNEYNSRK